jgi:hypothetical protein
MGSVLALARALANGGEILWDQPDRPRVRVPAPWVDAVRGEPEVLREVLRRAVEFRRQVAQAARGPIIPYLLLPSAPAPRLGACISCGVAIPSGWRCAICLLGVRIAIGVKPAADDDGEPVPA